MKKAALAALLAVTFSSAFAGAAFLKGERAAGTNKICFYDHLGNEVAITVKAIDLCPYQINI